MAIDRITDLAAFVRVSDARSFTIAAQQLGLSRSAVGKCVVRLEDSLGVRLLQRTTRSVTLTHEGEAFYARCVRVLADLEEIELDMASRTEQPRGRLRLDLPVSFGRLHVLPVLHRFMEMWPEVVVNVTFTDRYVDLIEEGIDVAIRIGGEEDSQLVGRTLARHRLVTCASPEYLASHDAPMTPTDLGDHSCLAFTHGGRPTEWRFRSQVPADGAETAVNEQFVRVHGRFCTSNSESLRDAVLAGYGIGQLATFLIGADLRAGRLQPILEDHALDGPPIRVVYPTGRHLSPKVRHFIDLLAETWRPEPPWDEAADVSRNSPTVP
ncbi:LysR family transcriptional regulator [Algihabitans albus]|uniref:LysR family transcriptional regulator n=1 Tax=Algihabitans albus TaxID=2164067 RepID=UPI000E5C883C|nr:LysR family transcriptional regulator [Algihabitans albus]